LRRKYIDLIIKDLPRTDQNWAWMNFNG
jgi:hypothetical protein